MLKAYLRRDLKRRLRIGVRQRHACSIPGALSAHLNFLSDTHFKDQATSDDTRALGHGKREWWRAEPRRAAYCLLKEERSPFGQRFEAEPSEQSAARCFALRIVRTDAT